MPASSSFAARADSSKLAGMNNTYLFDVQGAGMWLVTIEDGVLSVREGDGEADTRITASEENFQRILSGDQYMTVYKATKPEATVSAQIAVALAQGKPIPTSGLPVPQTKTNNGSADIPSYLLTPQEVTKDNAATVTYGGQPLIGSDGYWTVGDICTPEFQ